jgi:hypothetical protein
MSTAHHPHKLPGSRLVGRSPRRTLKQFPSRRTTRLRQPASAEATAGRPAFAHGYGELRGYGGQAITAQLFATSGQRVCFPASTVAELMRTNLAATLARRSRAKAAVAGTRAIMPNQSSTSPHWICSPWSPQNALSALTKQFLKSTPPKTPNLQCIVALSIVTKGLVARAASTGLLSLRCDQSLPAPFSIFSNFYRNFT